MPAASEPVPSEPADGRASTVAALAAAIAQVGPSGRPAPSKADRAEESPCRAPGPAGSARDGGRPSGRGAGRGRGSGNRGGSRHPGEPPPDDPAGLDGDDPGDPDAVAKNVCLRLLTVRARSRAELAQALRRRNVPADSADRVLDRLADVGLVDDASFAEAFVASKHRDRGLARGALRQELRRKGVDASSAERALASIDSTDERERAIALVNRKLDSAMFAGLPAARRRLLGMLARRGYPASMAASVVNDALRGYVEPLALDPTDQADDAGGEPW